jgi:hypothetical protein
MSLISFSTFWKQSHQLKETAELDHLLFQKQQPATAKQKITQDRKQKGSWFYPDKKPEMPLKYRLMAIKRKFFDERKPDVAINSFLKIRENESKELKTFLVSNDRIAKYFNHWVLPKLREEFNKQKKNSFAS